jgi:3-oxoacyl-[acyl-carrier protein] reductase
MTDDFRLDGRAVLVTGGAQGIGLGAVTECVAAGARALIADRNGEAARQAAAGFPDRAVAWVECDVATADGAAEMVRAATATFGRLDAALANAGINRGGALVDLPEEAWDEVVRVNLKAVFLCFQAAARVMIPQGSGSLIAISSIGGQRGTAGQVNYSASKAGVIGLVKGCARELAPSGIRVNAIAPGAIATPMSDIAFQDKELLARYLGEVPLGRMGRPADIGRAVRFLASDASEWITGQVLAVNGGAYM